MAGTGGVIMFVDNEPLVTEGARKLLKVSGYDVVVFENSPLAWETYAASPSCPIACLVADVEMPKLSGRELYRHCVDRWGRLPTVFISGSDLRNPQDYSDRPEVLFLRKPFRFEKLCKAIVAAIAVPFTSTNEQGDRR